MYQEQQFQIVDCSNMVSMLRNGNPAGIQEVYHNKQAIQATALALLDVYKKSNGQSVPGWDNVLDSLMQLCDIIYNNFDSMEVIDDGIYDGLAIIYRKTSPNPHIGGSPVPMQFTGNVEPEGKLDGAYYPFNVIDPEKAGDPSQWLFYHNLKKLPPFNPIFYGPRDREHYDKNQTNHLPVPHKYPKLVGTLEKCKFVLVSEAASYDLLDDPTVKIFERDFLYKHVQMGIVNPGFIELLIELKMDGMSVEADVTDKILSARSRGDTANEEADDLSVVFKDYKFPYCPEISDSFGMKFEAIITKQNLERLAKLKGRPYKNARNGVIGLIKSIDAQAYRDLITLVPLETSLDLDPVTEVQFMNRFYAKDVYLPYAVIRGDYNQVLYQVHRFVKEAEAIRDIMPYLYDGVVVHYTDPKIRQALGRVASVNQYSIAIKFNPMRKKTIFRGYTYTVGQDGRITPMIHYDPVEFLGAIHTKSSGHSYGRFRELQLCKGDVIEVTYVNDVMPYVTKPYQGQYVEEFGDTKYPEQFPTVCPFCGTPIEISDGGAGDLAICPNINCPERAVARVVNMLDKLGIKGFADAAVEKLQLKSFQEYLNLSPQKAIEALGQANGNKFIDERNRFVSTRLPDYRAIGSLGVTGVAAETWRKILRQIPVTSLPMLARTPLDLYHQLIQIKGIGPKTANVIMAELPLYQADIATLLQLPNIYPSYGEDKKVTVRWTGVRDPELEAKLMSMGIDASSKEGVTKNTNILVIPYPGFTSSKLSKIGAKTVVVPHDDFARDPTQYIVLAQL